MDTLTLIALGITVFFVVACYAGIKRIFKERQNTIVREKQQSPARGLRTSVLVLNALVLISYGYVIWSLSMLAFMAGSAAFIIWIGVFFAAVLILFLVGLSYALRSILIPILLLLPVAYFLVRIILPGTPMDL